MKIVRLIAAIGRHTVNAVGASIRYPSMGVRVVAAVVEDAGVSTQAYARTLTGERATARIQHQVRKHQLLRSARKAARLTVLEELAKHQLNPA